VAKGALPADVAVQPGWMVASCGAGSAQAVDINRRRETQLNNISGYRKPGYWRRRIRKCYTDDTRMVTNRALLTFPHLHACSKEALHLYLSLFLYRRCAGDFDGGPTGPEVQASRSGGNRGVRYKIAYLYDVNLNLCCTYVFLCVLPGRIYGKTRAQYICNCSSILLDCFPILVASA
jgi:hypothetical protein